eukprot:g15543.t1
MGGPGWNRLGVRRDTFFRWADQPSTAPLSCYSDQWRAAESGGVNIGATPLGGGGKAFVLVRTELKKRWVDVDEEEHID